MIRMFQRIRGHKQLSVLKETYETQLSNIVKLNTSLLVEITN